ncbi:uncharacterized protein LOC107801169 [Nicotiana tabacum]|uniref:Uncharacterized protein LOC107801169 n=6 Tax=Nicotiana tabacum TaxID=4097 RepID=A0AC58SAZ6_TOBAC
MLSNVCLQPSVSSRMIPRRILQRMSIPSAYLQIFFYQGITIEKQLVILEENCNLRGLYSSMCFWCFFYCSVHFFTLQLSEC